MLQQSLTLANSQQFRQGPDLCRGKRWTYRHAFFANQGGFLLQTSDYPTGFPINAKQLHYLAKHEHIDIPDLEGLQIEDRNVNDSLSRSVFSALDYSDYSLCEALLTLSKVHYYVASVLVFRDRTTKGLDRVANDYA